MRTVVNTFPVAGAGGGAPTVMDDCVTLTPVVVRPRRRNDSLSTDKTGPLGVGEAKLSVGSALHADIERAAMP